MIASMHIVRERPRRQPLVLARLGSDRWRVRVVPGLRFVRWLGTGAGDNTAMSADLRRSAIFAIWEDDASLDAFLADHWLPRRWRDAEEAWTVRMRGAGGHGTWHGVPVADLLNTPETSESLRLQPDQPVAFVTHADVRPGAWRAFAAAGRPVSDEVRRAEGLLAVIGIGEAPIGRLGTFSLWRSLADAQRFARGMPHHVETVARTHAERWYSDELFARFLPYASTGSWDGRDPLVDRPADPLASTGTNIP